MKYGKSSTSEQSDKVYTSQAIAKDMVEWFSPTGAILEPCAGGGVFLDLLPGAEWCEIEKGRDFYQWTLKVDWIITNPPYSKYAKWLRQCMYIARDVVLLNPTSKPFSSDTLIKDIFKWGGIKHIRHYGTGSSLGFPIGYAFAAIHFSKDWGNSTTHSRYTKPQANNPLQPELESWPIIKVHEQSKLEI